MTPLKGVLCPWRLPVYLINHLLHSVKICLYIILELLVKIICEKNNFELSARVGRLNAQLIEIPWLTPKECIMKGLAMLRLNAIGWIEKDARRRVARK